MKIQECLSYLCIWAGDVFKYEFGLLEMFAGCHVEVR